MSNQMIRLGVTFILALGLAGCETFEEFWGADDCQDKMKSVKSGNGDPEEIQSFDSGGNMKETWWYWSKGYSIDFSWGTSYDNCETSRFTFKPL